MQQATTVAPVQKLLSALSSGASLTPREIAARFRVKNPRDLVYRLRSDGYRINTIETTNTKGVTRRRYVMA